MERRKTELLSRAAFSRRKAAAVEWGSQWAAQFLCLPPVLLSLSCALAYSANDSAPIFFFALPKKKTVAGGQKKKGALMDSPKGPFNRFFSEPQVHTGHNLKAYAPFRTLSRLPWQFVQLGGVTAGFIACG